MVYTTEPLGIELHVAKRSVLRASKNSFYYNIRVQFYFTLMVLCLLLLCQYSQPQRSFIHFDWKSGNKEVYHTVLH